MATPQQIEANRRNAQHSTGPRSPEGKAATRFNAVRHGIDAQSLVIPGEDPAELDALTREYLDQFQPSGPLEVSLVETLARSEWMRRRYSRIEAQVVRHLVAEQEAAGVSSELAVGAVYAQDRGPLQRVIRRQESEQRNWFRALGELRRIHSARQDQEFEAGLQNPRPTLTAATTSQPPANGGNWVCSASAPIAAAAPGSASPSEGIPVGVIAPGR
jgi:hypothetical protein